ncbi:hypothetical protein IFM89_013964 [Coptis chinensis]|uniref:Elongation factor EFG domain-containing protein n=1 Tax=Coptis chinensis TaxID=261450 RepID=A0A835MB93_9MAGN|nr:hypothetical protein IFM89_013964 [Coptis chinensis]
MEEGLTVYDELLFCIGDNIHEIGCCIDVVFYLSLLCLDLEFWGVVVILHPEKIPPAVFLKKSPSNLTSRPPSDMLGVEEWTKYEYKNKDECINKVIGHTMARKAIYASQITAKPGLLEPLYMVEIQAPEHALGGIYGVFNQKRGYVFEEMQRPGTPLYNIKVYLPVRESFGFSGQLRAATSELASSAQCVFDHWDLVISDPLEAGSQAATLVSEICRRKGLKEQMTPLSEFDEL